MNIFRFVAEYVDMLKLVKIKSRCLLIASVYKYKYQIYACSH